jgi:hypothetical protein
MHNDTHLAIGSVAREFANDLVGLLVVEAQIRTLFRVAVGVVSMLLADANMSHFGAELPNDLHLGIPELHHAVLDAEGPLAAEVLIIVGDAKGLALGDALVVVVLVASSTDGVVNARKSDILHRNDPVIRSNGARLSGSAVGAASETAAGGARRAMLVDGRRRRRKEVDTESGWDRSQERQQRSSCELHRCLRWFCSVD